MATYQGTLQDATARMKGSGVLSVMAYDSAKAIALAADGGDSYSWTECGSLTGLKFEEAMVATQLKGDNALEDKYVSDQSLKVTFNQREAFLESVRAIIRGTFDTVTSVAASAVSGATQTIASGAGAYLTPVVIEHQNGDGSAVTVNSVAGATDPTLVVGTDYNVVTLPDGRTAVELISGGAISTLAQVFTIDYDYTPYASKSIHSGGKTTLPYFMAKIENTDENGKLVSIYLYKNSVDNGYNFTYKKDDEADPVGENAISMTAIIDNSITTLGKQLFHIYQERGI